VDAVEREGVARARQARGVSDLIVVIVDGSEPLTGDDLTLLEETKPQRRLIVANKSDLPAANDIEGALHVSAATGDGLLSLRCAMVRELTDGDHLRDTPALTNVRHVSLLEGARDALVRAEQALDADGIPEEFLLSDLQAARVRFDEVVGTRTSADVLNHIFERFCIGK
jgi:tRNA modification GTPase